LNQTKFFQLFCAAICGGPDHVAARKKSPTALHEAHGRSSPVSRQNARLWRSWTTQPVDVEILPGAQVLTTFYTGGVWIVGVLLLAALAAPKALMLVNFQTTQQRLVDQVAVPQDTNEEAALAAHLPKMDLAGVCLTADAAHTIKANCRQLTQGNGAEFFLILKANQPTALAKAEQLLSGTLPPLRPQRWTKTTPALKRAGFGACPAAPKRWA
jgi:hypothetical protein